jgi:glycosyltransferase involved in cell wall biosynthesis
MEKDVNGLPERDAKAAEYTSRKCDSPIEDLPVSRPSEADALASEAAADIQRMTLILQAANKARIEAEASARQARLECDQVVNSLTWRAARPIHHLLEHFPRPVSKAIGAFGSAAKRLLASTAEKQTRRTGDGSEASKSLHSLNSTIPFDLYDDNAVQAVVGPPREQVLWLPQQPATIVTIWSAARFCIDLLRDRKDLRERFPRALSDGESGGFAKWITSTGGDEFDLSHHAREKIREAFRRDLSARAWQTFFSEKNVRTAFPLGLTPIGRLDLFRWFIGVGQIEAILRLEEIWWFFIECAEDPARELVRTYLFTPDWQRRFPDGLTVFGRDALADWLSRTYHITEDWVNPDRWLVNLTPEQQLRLAYRSRQNWQDKHPSALSTADGTRALLDWLQTEDCGLGDRARNWCRQLNNSQIGSDFAVPGLNILGHFCYPSGLRTSVETIRDALMQAGVKVSQRDVRTGQDDDPGHARYDGMEIFDVTLIHVEPEPFFSSVYEHADLSERTPRTYRIAYWYWELDRIPDAWQKRWYSDQQKSVDEIWTATNFVAGAFRQSVDAPVHAMFPGIRLGTFQKRPRQYFGLPAENEFIFLFVFHMTSVMERKNPLGLIGAFKKAFSQKDAATLVIKTSFGERYPALMRELYAAGGGAKVRIIDSLFSSEETLSLIDACDAYASLHRSEGLGLTMGEAMLMGKPVVATAYSGNIDFMDPTNSLLVDYKLVELQATFGPYFAGAHWAEPSQDHAAQVMRTLYDNRPWAVELGKKAQADIEHRASLDAAGKRMNERLAQIAATQPQRAG